MRNFLLILKFLLLAYFGQSIENASAREASELRSCALDLMEAAGISSEKSAKRYDDPATQTCLKNVPPEYLEHPQFMELAYDPDQKNITKQSIREAMAAIELERSGRVAGPISRAPFASSADFADGEGHGIEIKAKSSARTSKGEEFDPMKLIEEIQGKLERDFKNPLTGEVERMKVFVDLTWLNQRDQDRLLFALGQNFGFDELALIEFFELPEPQEYFRVRP